VEISCALFEKRNFKTPSMVRLTCIDTKNENNYQLSLMNPRDGIVLQTELDNHAMYLGFYG